MAWPTKIMTTPITELDVNRRKAEVTGALSVQFRTMALGVLALCGGLLIGDLKTSFEMPEWVKLRLIGVAIAVIFALAMDLVQYLFAYLLTEQALKELQDAEKYGKKNNCSAPILDWNNNCWAHRAQMTMFWLKLVILFGFVGWMIVFMTYVLRHPPPKKDASNVIQTQLQ